MRNLIIVFLSVLTVSCNNDTLIKPAAKLRLDYPRANYKRFDADCRYTFEKNLNANLKVSNDCWMNLEYPHMDATIYLTYQQVTVNNLDSLLYDAQKLTYDHTIKADRILEQPRVDSVNNVYGMFYMIDGNAATQSQFYVTDSLDHFVTGSLYFKSKPNFDSLYPAVVYLRNDIKRIMESISWK